MSTTEKSIQSKGLIPERVPFQLGKVLVLSVSHFIHDMYSSFLAPLLPLLIDKLSLSLTQAGLLSTVMQIPALMNPFLGLIADRFSVRYFIILAPMMTAIPMSLIGVAPNYGVLLLLLFFTGISVAVFHVPAPVMIARSSGQRIGRGMSFFMTGGELARTLGPMLAVGAVSLFGLEGFYPIMIFGIVASGLLYLRFRNDPVSIAPKKKDPLSRTWRKLRHLFIPIMIILILRGFMHAAMTAFLPTFLEQKSGNLWLGGMGLVLLEGMGVLGVLISGSLSDRLGRRNVLLAAIVTAPICLFGFTYFEGWPRYAALSFLGLSLLSTTPVMLAFIQEHAADSPSAANGLFMMISFLARSAVVVLVGLVADHIGLTSTYYICAFMGMLAFPFVLMLPRRIITPSPSYAAAGK